LSRNTARRHDDSASQQLVLWNKLFNQMEETMKYFAIAILMTLATTASAITPDEVRGEYPLIVSGDCTIDNTGELGRCFIYKDTENEGFIYMVFVQDSMPVFMRHAGPDGFYKVWPLDEPDGVEL
jgi:hypothetical protein